MGQLHIVHYQTDMTWTGGGVMRAVFDCCAVLARRGHRMRLLTHEKGEIPESWFTGGEGLPTAQIIDPRVRFDRLPRSALAAASRAIAEADLVHLHTPWAVPNVQVARLSRNLNKPYVITIHGMLDDWCMSQQRAKKLVYLKLFGRQMLNHAARVHCTAAAEARQTRQWFDHDRITVMPNMFNTSEFTNLPGASLAEKQFPVMKTESPKVLFLSRLHPKKGLEFLLDAVAILRRRGMPVQLIVAGDGEPAYVEALRQRAKTAGIQEIVHFIGLVRDDLKRSVYQAADLFVLPTSQENYGLVLPEAMACGTPIVTTRGVDIWEELEQAGGTIVDQSADAIADALVRLLSDRSRLKVLGEQGRRWVLEHLDSQRLASDYERLYQQVRDSTSAPG